MPFSVVRQKFSDVPVAESAVYMVRVEEILHIKNLYKP